jgi:hypothetical protein
MYVTPHPESPVFGRWTKPFLADRYDFYTAERPAYANIYLGLTMLAMAFVGIGWLAGRLRREGRAALSDRRVAAGVASLVAAVIALLFSGPPRVSLLGLEIPLPEELVLRASTAFRVTHRFGLVVMLCVCLLAALGLRAILAGRSTAITAAVVAVLAVAVPLDLWGRQVHGAMRVTYPEVYSTLRDEPRGTLAVYPLSPLTDNVAIFFRPAHRKPVFNGYRTGSETHPLKGDLQDLAQPSTVPRLAALGVRYVIVTPGGSQPWQPQPDQRFRGLQFVMGSKDGSLFRVVARPAAAIVSFGSGFFPAEWNSPRFLRWMTAPEAHIELRGSCEPCVGQVRLTAASLAQDRVLRVTDEQGELIAVRRVRAHPTAISFPVRFQRRARITLGTLPGPELISEATGTADYRRVSIQVEVPMSFVSSR